MVRENPKVAEMLQWWASSVAAPVMAVWSIYHRWQTIEVERSELLQPPTPRLPSHAPLYSLLVFGERKD